MLAGWSWRRDLNLQPPVYKTGALPLSYASNRNSCNHAIIPSCCHDGRGPAYATQKGRHLYVAAAKESRRTSPSDAKSIRPLSDVVGDGDGQRPVWPSVPGLASWGEEEIVAGRVAVNANVYFGPIGRWVYD